MVLVGTKVELREDRGTIEQSWTDHGRGLVTSVEGATLATRIGAMEFVECSAVTGEGVKDVVEAVGRTALLSRRRIRNEKKDKECVVL